MNGASMIFWVIFPYVIITLFLASTIYRFRSEPYGWTSKSSEILEKRLLRWGSPLFHWGILFVFAGHIGGLLVPLSVYHSLGVSDEAYHAVALTMGSVAGAAAFLGLLILLYRRMTVRRIKVTSSAGDIAVLFFLIIVVGTGMLATSNNALAESGFDYRTTINPWIRGVLSLRPDPSLMADVPLYFKVHIVAAFGLFAAFPFTRLVHVLTIPISYLWRSYVVYRRRGAVSAQNRYE